MPIKWEVSKDMGKDFLIRCYVIPDGIVVVKLLSINIFFALLAVFVNIW